MNAIKSLVNLRVQWMSVDTEGSKSLWYVKNDATPLYASLIIYADSPIQSSNLQSFP